MTRRPSTRAVVGVVAGAIAASFAIAPFLGDAAPSDVVSFPSCFANTIKVGAAVVYSGAPASCSSTTTTRPATSAPTTAPATTTTRPATTAPTSSTTPAPATTVAPTTTGAPGAAFVETFADPSAFATRFDRGWSGELHAGAAFNGDRNDYMGDHDGTCGDPNNTHRTVHIFGGNNETGQQNPGAAAQAFYSCVPGGDPAKGHVMTAIDTEGYVIGWFSPKGTFNNVHRVCWDQSEQQNGGGNWTQVVFVTAAELAAHGSADLAYTSPEFPNNGGASVANGTSRFGVKDFGTITAWANGQFTAGEVASTRTTSHAPRFTRCVTDNEDGTLAVTAAQPDGTTASGTIAGQIPNGQIRVVFEHDTYNPGKHYNLDTNDGKATAPMDIYTWHWDNIRVETV